MPCVEIHTQTPCRHGEHRRQTERWVEEQFYVLAPLLVFLWRRQPWAGRWALAATTLASAGACLWASQHMPAAAFYFVGFRFWELGLGVLCYVFTQEARLGVKSRLIINALFEQFGFFLLPFLQRLNRRKMVERTLWNQLVVSFHIALKRCLQLSC